MPADFDAIKVQGEAFPKDDFEYVDIRVDGEFVATVNVREDTYEVQIHDHTEPGEVIESVHRDRLIREADDE